MIPGGSLWTGGPVEYPRPEGYVAEPVPRVGEVVAPRLWWADDVPKEGWHLRSVFQLNTWLPGVPMEGEPAWYMNGVHGWKMPAHLDEYEEQLGHMGRIFVRGTVELWGRVVEHEKGYRAQYAYPLTLDRLVIGQGINWDHAAMRWNGAPQPPDDLLDQLRLRYLA
jgi:hypothetical protein